MNRSGDSDLANIILRAKNGQTVTGTVYATVETGVKTYADTDIAGGDAVYYIESMDTLNNASR